MSRRKKITVFGGFVVLVAIIGTISATSRGDGSTAVRLEEVERRDLVATVTASGMIAPQRSVDVSSDITGRITELLIEEGDEVQRGQVLLRIDRTQYQAALARSEALLSSARASELQAKANRDQAERAMERSLELRRTDSNLVSDEQMEQAVTNFDVAEATWEAQQHQVSQAEAALEEARDQLSKTVILAPMSGKVTRLAVEEGEVALASTFSRETGLLMTISDLSIIQVNVQVDETDVVRLHLNDSAEVTIDAYPDTVFSGKVTTISQSSIAQPAQSGSGADRAVDYDVEITLDDPPEGIRPDLSATARVVTDQRFEALSIPIIALTVREHTPISTEVAPQEETEAEETEGVFVVEDGVVFFRPVRVGIAGNEFFEVLEGLEEGDTIAAGPYQTVRDLRDSTRVKGMESGGDSEED